MVVFIGFFAEMTVPKSKVLSVSKGILALADLKHNSPEVSQHVVVNVRSNDTKAEREPKTRNAVINGECTASGEPYGSDVVIVQPSPSSPSPQMDVKYDPPNPYAAASRPTGEPCEPYSAITHLQALVSEKESIAKALSIMLELVENNPLIINKLIIAPSATLAELIKLLASADDVKISYMLDQDVGCSCGSVKYVPIDKIYVVKHGDTQVLKYAYPDVIQILDQHRISYKLVADA
ncbi:MAG: hypothetical protein ACOYEB_12560 [Enterococcus lemanii]|jgi:hypothetical protein